MDFDFFDTGTGPALLFLPGSYSSHAGWKGIQKALNGSYRLITTSLPGYGGSREVRDDQVSDMTAMCNFVAKIVDHIGEPVHLIGHSFGGLTAFASVLSGKVSPLSLITFEGNPIYSRPDTGEFEWVSDIGDMRNRFEAAYAAGDPDAAGLIIDFWSQPGVFSSMPETFQDYCRSTVYSNVLDWRCAGGFTPVIGDYGIIDVPSTIVRGEYANKPIVDLCNEIGQTIPDASLRIVEGSGHFLISSHPQECAQIIDEHMQGFASQNQ